MSYLNNPEEELKKYKKGDQIKVKVLEIKKDDQKIRVGLKQLEKDPFDWFKDKKVNDIITVQVISSDNKGLLVRSHFLLWALWLLLLHQNVFLLPLL